MLGPETHQGLLVLLYADEGLPAVPNDHHALAWLHALAFLDKILLDAIVGLLKVSECIMEP